MILAEVVGTVVSTRKDSNLLGLKLLLTREVDSHMKPTGNWVVAADAVAIEVDHLKSEENAPVADALEALDIPGSAAEALLEEVRKDQENLAGFLTVR